MNKIFIWLIILLLSFESVFAAADDLADILPHRIFVLKGTSSAGKSTTAAALRERLEETGKTVLVTGCDALGDGDEGKQFSSFLKEMLRESGLQATITRAHNLPFDTDLLSSDARIYMTTDEVEAIENLLKTPAEEWEIKRLTSLTLKAYSTGKYVILDVLEDEQLISALVKSGIPQPQILTSLLYVPIGNYLSRIGKRNSEALETYREEPTSDGDNDLRDPFEMIGQYGLYFRMTPTPSRRDDQEITPSALQGIFEQAREEARDLFSLCAALYRDQGKENEAQVLELEIATMDETRDTTIGEYMRTLNPHELEEGHLTIFTPTDLILNTEELTTESLVDRILIQVAVTRTSLRKAETEQFIDRCLTENPEYYRYTSLGQIREALQTDSPASLRLKAELTAEDTQEILGWHKITETERWTGRKQTSGLLVLEGDKNTGYIEAHLIYLPKDLLFSRTSLSPRVLEWAKEHIIPLIGTELPFFDELDETLAPRFQNTPVSGTCVSISCWNYPSLITATRSEFKIASLVSRTFWGHGYLLVYPHVPGSNPALEEYLAANPGMPALVERAQEGLDLLENRETRDEGKGVLKDVYYRSSGIYRIAKWTASGVLTGAAALAVWWLRKR